MQITGKRRLIFGLYTVSCACAVQLVNPWTKEGAILLGGITVAFYGERLVTSLVDLIKAWRNK